MSATPDESAKSAGTTSKEAPGAGSADVTFPAAVVSPGAESITVEARAPDSAGRIPLGKIERGAFPSSWLIVFLFDVIATVGYLKGYIATGMTALAFFEILAILNTIGAAFLYFADLYQAADNNLLTRKQGWLVGVTLLGAVNVVMLAIAGISRYLHELGLSQPTVFGVESGEFMYWSNITYVILLILSFSMFAILDVVFSWKSISDRKTREYWELLFFVDAPVSIAFLILGTLYVLDARSVDLQPPISFEVLSGAIITQMIFADLLFLLVQTNLHHIALEKLRANVPSREDPPPR
jgi:hypothetical protein